MLHLFVIDQHESVIIVHTPTPSEASLPFLITPPEVTDHQPGVPGYTATFHQLCILHLAGHIRLCYFLHSSHSLRPRLCPQIHSLRLRFHSFPANRFIKTIFLDSIYIYVNIQYLLFSFWLTSLYVTDSISLKHSFLCLGNIRVCVCVCVCVSLSLYSSVDRHIKVASKT